MAKVEYVGGVDDGEKKKLTRRMMTKFAPCGTHFARSCCLWSILRTLEYEKKAPI